MHIRRFVRLPILPIKVHRWRECTPLLTGAFTFRQHRPPFSHLSTLRLLNQIRPLFGRERQLETAIRRVMATSSAQPSAFLTRKASPNILVLFLGTSNISKDEEQILLERMNKSIEAIYGIDRFVLYRIQEADLAIDSKLFSASALVVVTRPRTGASAGKVATYRSNIPQVTVDLNLLTAGDQFNWQYFESQMKSCIPETTSPSSNQTDQVSSQCSAIFLFTSDASYEKWLQITRVKGVDLTEYCDDVELTDVASENKVIFVDCRQNVNRTKLPFNFSASLYFEQLKTTYLGRTVLMADRFTSTMDLADRFRNVNGLVAIANYQTAGIGRQNNKWLSPHGCAMFTTNLQLNSGSGCFSRMSLIQHLVSLSVVLALPPQLNIKIKWPNDILFVDSMSKLAGILVRSFLFGSTVNVQIGIGFNLSNGHPSVCLDDIIQQYNSSQLEGSPKLERITKETLIARILNQFELLLAMLEEGRVSEIKQLYLSSWIHSNMDIEVHDNKDGSKRAAVICGIDDSGYLLAEYSATGEKISLQPDGNRFDLMHRLVVLNC